MFRKTRLRLTLLNATVMFMIMSVLGTTLYLFLDKQILGKFDQFLIEQAERYKNNSSFGIRTSAAFVPAPVPVPAFPRAVLADRFIHMLYWDEQDQLINIFDAAQYPESLLAKLKDSLHYTEAYTIRAQDVKYRVLNVADPIVGILSIGPTTQVRSTATLQLIINVTAESKLLDMLLWMIALGICIGAILSVFAGLYLADKALVPIQSSWTRQQQFVADASHELRTPLAVMQSHAELMLRHPDHTIEQDSREISTILKEVHRMKKLVTALLTLARTDSGQLLLSRKRVRVDMLADQIIAQMRPLADLKQIEIRQELEPELAMDADEERLHQLLAILLDNAIQYTPEGGKITVICCKQSGGLLLSVADTGIGLSKDELPHIFDRFYRGDKQRSRTDGGTGLGLSIAQWIVRQHGGRIRVESAIGEGTTFYIQLPL